MMEITHITSSDIERLIKLCYGDHDREVCDRVGDLTLKDLKSAVVRWSYEQYEEQEHSPVGHSMVSEFFASVGSTAVSADYTVQVDGAAVELSIDGYGVHIQGKKRSESYEYVDFISWNRSKCQVTDLTEGTRVKIRRHGGKDYQFGRVAGLNKNGTFQIQYEDDRVEQRVARNLIEAVDTELDSLVLNVSIQVGRKTKEIEIVSDEASTIFSCINAWVSETSVYEVELKDKLAEARVRELLYELNDRVAAPTYAETLWVLKRSIAKGSSNEFNRRNLRDAVRVWYTCVFPRRDEKIGHFQETEEREFMYKVRIMMHRVGNLVFSRFSSLHRTLCQLPRLPELTLCCEMRRSVKIEVRFCDCATNKRLTPA
jgi:hypothetical protein